MQHDEDIWLVKLDDGHVRSMTLDELDAAFQKDEIHERTMICRSDGDRWITLAEEIGGAPTPTPSPTPTPTPSVLPVVADVGEDHAPISSSRKGTRIVAGLLGVIVLGAFGAFAATTAVNASRTRARAALASQLAAAAALEARAHDNDPEPEATTQARDTNKPQTRERRRNVRNQGSGGTQQAPQDKPAATVFTTGGDEHDPLNAKL